MATHSPHLPWRERTRLRAMMISWSGGRPWASPDLFEDQADPPQNPPTAEPVAKPKGPAAGSKKGEETHDGARGVVSLADEKHWRDLREVWTRGWASDDSARSIAVDRAAFARACAVAEGGEDIVAAAKAWREAADAPRFLPRLCDWLDTRGWAKPPPIKRKERSSRRGGDGLPRTNGHKVNLTRLCLRMGGYREAPDGSLYHPDGDEGSSFDWGRST